jgi:DNA-binding MarR family transcriptional regulator
MSAFIRNLEDLGFVARHLDESDRRRFNISLTENGRSLVSQYTHTHLQSINHCFDVLTAEEQQTMLNLLQKLGAHVTAVCQQNK